MKRDISLMAKPDVTAITIVVQIYNISAITLIKVIEFSMYAPSSLAAGCKAACQNGWTSYLFPAWL
jgi:hypothetical protein